MGQPSLEQIQGFETRFNEGDVVSGIEASDPEGLGVNIQDWRGRGFSNREIIDGIKAGISDIAPPQPSTISQEPSMRDVAAGAIRTTLEGVGGVAGSLPGIATANPLAAGVGGALGFAAGGEAADISDTLLGVREVGTVGEELVQAGERIGQGAIQEIVGAGTGAAFQLLTKGGANLVAGAGKIGTKRLAKEIGMTFEEVTELQKGITGPKPLRNAIIKRLSPEDLELVKSASKTGFSISPGEAARNVFPVFNKAENFFRRWITSAGKFEAFDQKNLEVLIRRREGLIKRASAGRVVNERDVERLGIEISEQIDKLLKNKTKLLGKDLEALKDSTLKLFGSNDTSETLGKGLLKNISERTKEIADSAQDIFTNISKDLPQGGADNVDINNIVNTVNTLSSENKKGFIPNSKLDSFLKKIKSKSAQTRTPRAVIADAPTNTLTYNEVTDLRKTLNALIAAGDEQFRAAPGGDLQFRLLSSKEAAAYKQLKKALDNDLGVFSDATGGTIKKQFDSAITLLREGKRFIKDKGIRKLLRSEPNIITRSLIKPGRIQTVQLLKRELGESGIKPIQDDVANNIFTSADPLEWSRQVSRFGDDSLEELFGKKTFNDFRRVIGAGITKKQLAEPEIKSLASLVKKFDAAPEKVVSLVFKKDAPRAAKRILSLVGKEKEGELKVSLIESLLGKRGDKKFSIPNLVKEFESLGSTAKAVLTKEQFSEIKNIAQAVELSIIQPGRFGLLEMNLAGSIVLGGGGFAAGGPLGGIGAVLLPRQISNLLLKKEGRNLLLRGFRGAGNQKEAVEIASKLLQIVSRNLDKQSRGRQPQETPVQ